MTSLLLNIVMWTILIGMGVLAISVPIIKRPEISWLKFLVAGPFVMFVPAKYFGGKWYKLPSIIFFAVMSLSVLAWMLSWFRDNY